MGSIALGNSMKKIYYMFGPDIESPSNEAKKILDSMLDASNEFGMREASSIIEAIFSKNLFSPFDYSIDPKDVVMRFEKEFVSFLSKVKSKPSSEAISLLKDLKMEQPSVYAISSSSATAGLYATLSTLGVSGGEVITTSFNFMGDVNAIVMAGAKPIFVDIDEATWCMNPQSMRNALTDKTRAVLLTHVNTIADLRGFFDVLEIDGRDIPLIQDASLAVANSWNGIRPGMINIGSKGCTVISTASSKLISGLGGAMIISNNESFIHDISIFLHQGISLEEGISNPHFGGNFKMNPLNAAFGLGQLKRLDEILDKRSHMQSMYDECLESLFKSEKIVLQSIQSDDLLTHYGIRVSRRGEVATELYKKNGIMLGAWPAYHTAHSYIERFGKIGRQLSVTDTLAPEIAYLPIHAGLSDDDIRFICEKLAEEINSDA